MWQDWDKDGCRDLLRQLSDADIDSLIDTTSQGKIKVDTRKEKIEAILSFSESAECLLKRRKITMGVLINYAFSKGITVPGNSKKPELQASILQYWKEQKHHTKSCSSPHEPHQTESSHVPLAMQLQRPEASIPEVNIHNEIHMTHVSNYFVTSPTVTAAKIDHSDHQMAVSFIEWFFKIFNSFHPNSETHQGDFGPQHFWENAELHVHIKLSSREEVQHAVGSEQVVRMLTSFITNEGLIFNPNTSKEGILIRSDPHGLKLIMVCGSLFKGNCCVGVFQQSFGLVMDPLCRDIWKVKVSFLKMKEESVQACPSLQMMGDVRSIEDLTIKALEQAVTS